MLQRLPSRFLIPVHNPGGALVRLLDHISSLPDISLSEVVVINDGSSDGTSEILRDQFPEVECLTGDGSWFWTGCMVEGMKHALKKGAQNIFWLNHDCRPLAGAADLLRMALAEAPIACASAWCRIAGYPAWPVNPGVLHNKDVGVLEPGETRAVDGVNGNFVGFRSDAIHQVGFPNPSRFPHYGDGPYTLAFSNHGYRVVVVADARADLDYEVLRRLPPYWRVVLSEAGAGVWIRYFLFNIKSRFHWKVALHESIAYRGILGPMGYLKKTFLLLAGIFCGIINRNLKSRNVLIEQAIDTFSVRFPKDKLLSELALSHE